MLNKIKRPLDPYASTWGLFWEQNPQLNRGVGADGVNDDAGDGDGKEGGEGEPGDKTPGEGGSESDKSGDNGGEGKGDDNKGPSDAEAKLLKEVMNKKAALKVQTDEINNLKAKLKSFDGVDLKKVQELIDKQKEAETKELEKKGDWDKLRAQIVEQNEEKSTKLTTEIADLKAALSGKDGVINDLTVGHMFDSSKFISEKLTLTPGKARIIYGNHFDVEEGAVVAYDKPKGVAGRTVIVDGEGKPSGFELAISKIIDSDQDRDQLVKSLAKPGSNSKPNAGKAKAEAPVLRGADKIASALSAAGNK